MGAAIKTLYDTDFVEWTARTVEMLQEGRLNEADLEHVAEEIQDLGASERSAVRSQLRRMLMHLVKQRIQPERDGASWRASTANAQLEIMDKIAISPSLRAFAKENLEQLYREAVGIALIETDLTERAGDLNLDPTSPFSLDELLSSDPAVFWRR